MPVLDAGLRGSGSFKSPKIVASIAARVLSNHGEIECQGEWAGSGAISIDVL